MHLDHDRIGQVQRSPKESCYQEITYPSPISNLNLESHVSCFFLQQQKLPIWSGTYPPQKMRGTKQIPRRAENVEFIISRWLQNHQRALFFARGRRIAEGICTCIYSNSSSSAIARTATTLPRASREKTKWFSDPGIGAHKTNASENTPVIIRFLQTCSVRDDSLRASRPPVPLREKKHVCS